MWSPCAFLPTHACSYIWLTHLTHSLHTQTDTFYQLPALFFFATFFLLVDTHRYSVSCFSHPTFLPRCDHTSPSLPHLPFLSLFPALSPSSLSLSQSPVGWSDTSSQSVYLLKLATSAPLSSSPLLFSLVSFLWAPHHCVSTLPVSFSVPSLCSANSPRGTCPNHKRHSSHK